MQARGAPGQLLAGGRGGAVADEQDHGRGGRRGLTLAPLLRGRLLVGPRAGGVGGSGHRNNLSSALVDAVRRAAVVPGGMGQDRPAWPRPRQRRPPAGPGRAGGRGHRVPGLPAAGGLAGGGGGHAAGRVPRRGVLGAAGAGVRRPRRPGVPGRAGARGPRGQPHGPDVHRRPLGRLPVRRAAPHRFRQPADLDPPGDGLALAGAWITAPVRCAPPANKPTPAERDTCRPWMERELALLPGITAFVPLGQFAYQVLCGVLGVRPRPPFGHGAEVAAARRPRDRLQLSREPAEHLHRDADPGHVRRGAHRAACWPDWPRPPEHVVSGTDRARLRGGKAPRPACPITSASTSARPTPLPPSSAAARSRR